MTEFIHDPLFGLSPDQAGRYAQELRDNPLWMQLFIELDNRAVEAWRHSGNPQQREACWHQMQANQALRHQVEGWIDNVKLEAASAAKRARNAA